MNRGERGRVGATRVALVDVFVCSVACCGRLMWLQEPVKTGAITDEEIAELKCKYVCAGCGRPEVNTLTKSAHERHCPYLIDICPG